MSIFKNWFKRRDPMHPELAILRESSYWRESKDWLSLEDALTIVAYCNMCKEEHRIAVIGITKIRTRTVDIIMMSPTVDNLCSNMRRDRNPINLNFL